jgi:hypothetical protein
MIERTFLLDLFGAGLLSLLSSDPSSSELDNAMMVFDFFACKKRYMKINL